MSQNLDLISYFDNSFSELNADGIKSAVDELFREVLTGTVSFPEQVKQEFYDRKSRIAFLSGFLYAKLSNQGFPTGTDTIQKVADAVGKPYHEWLAVVTEKLKDEIKLGRISIQEYASRVSDLQRLFDPSDLLKIF